MLLMLLRKQEKRSAEGSEGTVCQLMMMTMDERDEE